MNHLLTPPNKPLRVLLLGPAFPDRVGGLQLALQDVSRQLVERGWVVDEKIWASLGSDTLPTVDDVRLHSSLDRSRLTTFQRWPFLWALWERTPAIIRKVLSITSAPRQYFADISTNFFAIEQWLDVHDYDLVLFCIDCAPPGLGALLTARRKNVVIISLQGLGVELQSKLFFLWARMLAWIYLRNNLHAYVFRQITSTSISLAIMASEQWRDEAIRAGLPPERAQAIYFGVPCGACAVRSFVTGTRLLWVGRMTKEKGLHWLLHALPAIRQQVPSVTLTVISGPGPAAYRRVIEKLVASLGLMDIVTFVPAMSRDALRNYYGSHDVLFFHSVFSEPVALVLMEAFASGLPVVASSPQVPSRLLQDSVTCLCYSVDRPNALRDAVVKMLTQEDLRRRLATQAQRLIREEFSMRAMGRAYDHALRRLVRESQSDTPPECG